MSLSKQAVDQFVASILNSVAGHVNTAISNSLGSGGSGSGSFGTTGKISGGAGGLNIPQQNIPEMVGGSGPAGTGFSNQSNFGTVAKAAAFTALGAAAGNSMDVQAAMDMDTFTSRSRAFGTSATSYLDVFKMQNQYAAGGTPISALDTAQAISNVGMSGIGVGTSQFRSTMKGAQQVSNIMPGMGLAGGANVAMSMQTPQAVNYGNAIGIKLRDMQTGKIASVGDLANQIWDKMKMYKRDPGPITVDDLTVALLPGASVDSLLNQIAPDETLKQAIIAMLYARAKGVSAKYRPKELRKAGFSTETIETQAESNTSMQKYLQTTSGPLLTGYRGGLNVSTDMRDFSTALREAIPALNALAALSGFGAGMNRADGGLVAGNKQYVVGERGPELFIPKQSGFIIPNKKLKQTDVEKDPKGDTQTAPKYMTKQEGKVWIKDFLRQLGGELGVNLLTDKNLEAWGRVAQHERGGMNNRAAYNPFNTTLKYNNSWAMNNLGNGMGVQGYWTKQDGITATINTLLGTKGVGYDKILSAMSNPKADYMDVLQAFTDSQWGGSKDNIDWENIPVLWGKNTVRTEATNRYGKIKKNRFITPGDVSGAGGGGINSPSQNYINSILNGNYDYSGSSIAGQLAFNDPFNISGSPTTGGGYAQMAKDAFRSYIQGLTPGMQNAFAVNKRRFGGPVTAGASYMVGEDGPEMFVPSNSNKPSYGGVTIYITADSSYDEDKLARKIKDVLHDGTIIKKAGEF